MMGAKGGPSVGILLGMKPEKGKESEEPESESEDLDLAKEALKTAAQELIDAVKKGDAQAVADALQSAVTACKDCESED